MILTLLLLVSPLPSLAAVQDVDLCFEIETEFTDPGGDWWPDNAPRPARGMYFTTKKSGGSPKWYKLDDDGCLTVSLETSTFTLVSAWSRAWVNGINLYSYTEDAETTDRGDLVLEDAGFFLPAHVTSRTFTVPWHQTFGNLAVGMWAAWRSDYGLGSYSDRGCCLSGERAGCEHADGTCDYTGWLCDASVPYQAWEDDNPMELVFVNQTWVGGECCGSMWPGRCVTGDGDPGRCYGGYYNYQADPTLFFPFVRINHAWRFQIAHELGHVIVAKRMGKPTARNGTAPLEGCMGSWFWDASLGALVEADKDDLPGRKSEITREYHSMAAREGWASFFSSYLWNEKEDDCVFNTQIFHDFDLDADMDNNYGASWYYGDQSNEDGSYDCYGAGVDCIGQPDTSDPLSGDIVGIDWLKEVDDAGLCGDGTSYVTRYDRFGTQLDWHHYFWHMYAVQDVSIEDLAALYVDACPTNWLQYDRDDPNGDTSDITWEAFPTHRFMQSAIQHGLLLKHNLEKVHGLSHTDPD
jgi:hypothetical protein